MSETLYLIFGLAVVVALIFLAATLAAQIRVLRDLMARQSGTLEERHRAMLLDLHDGLTKQGDRLTGVLADNAHRLQQQLTGATETLARNLDTRLEQISGKVNERLEEGFKKTNETFVSVMTRLATIDEAQKKIETLTGNVVGLQELLGDKRSRGAFGEMQLEQIVRNQLPEAAFEFQYTFSRGVRVDCVLKLPEPMGLLAVDSKFPLENYERMFLEGADRISPGAFKMDIRRHVDAIAEKYIIPGETSDGAIMFVPAEAVFAEIHARHRDLVEHAQAKHVWIASPTTLMAIINTVRVVIRDVETRKQIHIIKGELSKLGKDFARFDERMKKLAEHIRQAHEDAQDVRISGRKLTQRFETIERVELDGPQPQPQLRVVEPGSEQ